MYSLIDGDVLVYSCGFASQRNEYKINNNIFDYKRDANKYCTTHNIDRSLIDKKIIAEPVSHALHNVKQSLIEISQACDSHEGSIFLTGKGNYRHDVATSAVYKGNRDPSHKPVHYRAIIDYLIKEWDAKVIDGMEADDAMGITQCRLNKTKNLAKKDMPIICTIDKDLDMIPGWHYNFRKQQKYFTTVEQSDYFFYKQMLTGDRVDNIIGIHGIGDKTADKLLLGKSVQEMEDIIINKYRQEFKDDYMKRYAENKKLLWILREPLDGMVC